MSRRVVTLQLVRNDHTRDIPQPLQELAKELLGCLLIPPALAAEIIKALYREGLSVRGAQGRTGIAAADFSRNRNADLGRFTVDRLLSQTGVVHC